MSTELEQTKGKIKLVGKVKGIDNENAYKEGFTKSDKPYKSLAFFIETSEVNKVRVELFGMERDHVFAYSQKAKDSKKIPWAKRHDNHDDFKVMGVNMYLERESENSEKNIRKVMVEYDAIDYIKANLSDGDVVKIGGTIDFDMYENSEGVEVETKRFNFNSISKIYEELDFNSESFKEVAQFEQEIVVTDTMIDEESKKLIINAKIIKYGNKIADTSFVVNGEDYPKLANNMAKRLGYGDFIKVYGNIVNSVIRKEAEDIEEDIDDEEDWGGDEEIKKDFETNYINDYIQELQIISVDSSSYEKGKYKEEDLLNEEEDKFNGNVDGDDFSDDDEDDIEDLPFS